MTSLDHSCPELADEPEAHQDQMRGRLRAFEEESTSERMRRLGIERGSYDDRAVQRTTFTPASTQGRSQSGGSNHGTG